MDSNLSIFLAGRIYERLVEHLAAKKGRYKSGEPLRFNVCVPNIYLVDTFTADTDEIKNEFLRCFNMYDISHTWEINLFWIDQMEDLLDVQIILVHSRECERARLKQALCDIKYPVFEGMKPEVSFKNQFPREIRCIPQLRLQRDTPR